MIITTNQSGTIFSIPIQLVFWGFVAVYILHILEESVLGEVFVEKVRKKIWPGYDWKKFFGFNTILLSLNIAAVLLHENLGGAWIIFPLSLASERLLNGLYHFGETIITRKFSSGLLTSVLTWILGYFIIRYSILQGQIEVSFLIVSIIIGIIIETMMVGSMALMRKMKLKR